ncbi:MAG: substrate-binding domain-containing protein [Nitrospirae bacterium]|nr:substrate-binding domain-containing protein [Nitrospirota bacterium]
MNMRVHVICICLLASALFVGAAGAEEKIRLAGSGGMIPIMNDLAKEYMAENRNVRIEINQKSIESKGGIMSAAEGRVDIGMAARTLKDDEKNLGLQATEIARVGTVIGVNKNVSLREITSEQLCRIYEGRLASWGELKAGKDNIMALTRPNQDATKETVRKYIPCFADLKEPDTVISIATAPEMTKVLTNRPNTIGFTDAVAVESSGGAIVPLKLDGVDPTPDNVKSGKYKVIKSFFLMTKGQPSGAVKEFIAFVRGPKGARIIGSHKAVPVK